MKRLYYAYPSWPKILILQFSFKKNANYTISNNSIYTENVLDSIQVRSLKKKFRKESGSLGLFGYAPTPPLKKNINIEKKVSITKLDWFY